MIRFIFRGLAVLVTVGAIFAARPGRADERVSLETRPGVTQPFYLTVPAGKPAASLILFPGGNGAIGASLPTDLQHGNFLVRSRDLFAAQGFVVAVIDVPSDEAGGMEDSFRSGAAHRGDIAAVVAYLRHAYPVPVWLVGTSRGTISAANGATLETGRADGLVLTSSVMLGSPRNPGSVYSNDLGRVRIPTLVVHNREDACPVCPFGATDPLLSRFVASPRKQLIVFEGGAPPISGPCDALSRHGYLGIEDNVVAAIADWIKAK